MKRLFYPLVLIALLTNTGTGWSQSGPSSGISFYVLRVIYQQSEKQGAVLTMYSKTGTPYLLQSWVRPVNHQTGDVDLDWRGAPASPFIITPPLSRLEPNGELTLRIRRNEVPLPDDRESVFFISVKALPSQMSGSNQGQMVMTVVSNIKIFYRPKGLAKRAVEDAALRLTFRSQGKNLVAINPTPYWLTFSSLSVGEERLDKPSLRIMVPPLGEQIYTLKSPASGNIAWKLIDEDGWDTPEKVQSL